jgi:hypothetical protein
VAYGHACLKGLYGCGIQPRCVSHRDDPCGIVRAPSCICFSASTPLGDKTEPTGGTKGDEITRLNLDHNPSVEGPDVRRGGHVFVDYHELLSLAQRRNVAGAGALLPNPKLIAWGLTQLGVPREILRAPEGSHQSRGHFAPNPRAPRISPADFARWFCEGKGRAHRAPQQVLAAACCFNETAGVST